MRPLTVALVGGGRWGRVHASVITALHPRVERLLWVSRHNKTLIEQLDMRPPHPVEVEIVPGLHDALSRKPDAVVVCTASAHHARDASTILQNGIPVLVEKPLALNEPSAAAVIELARQRQLPLCICLPMLLASYLHAFKAGCGKRAVAGLRLSWFDPEVEARYGEEKYTDISTHQADEIFPHLWSIADVLVGCDTTRVVDVSLTSSNEISLVLDCDGIRVEAKFGRRAARRVREIELYFADGGHAELDFAREPGRASIDDDVYPLENVWESRPRPLASVYGSFLDLLDDGSSEILGSPFVASRCIDMVRLTDEIRGKIAGLEATRAAVLIKSGHHVVESPELSRLLTDNLVPELIQLDFPVRSWGGEELRDLTKSAQDEIDRRWRAQTSSHSSHADGYQNALGSSSFIGQIVDALRA
jgi:hypothetical protein